MVFLVRNHLLLEKKMVLPGEDLQKPSFSREKDGFSKDGCSKPSFSREKDGFEPTNHLFLEKTQKIQKSHLLEAPAPYFGKDVFLGLFWFFLVFSRKRWFVWFETVFFLEKKMVLSNHPSKEPSFLEKKMVLPGEDLQKPFFLEKMMVSNQKSKFFLEKTKNLLAAPAP